MTPPRLRDEWRACFRFIRSPHLTRTIRVAPPLVGRLRDWYPTIGLGRLFAWAMTLWLINIFVLGPFVLEAFEASGATHRINVNNLPWLQAILWAPLVEELLFRYCLRRPVSVFWLVPAMSLVLVYGVQSWASWLLAVIVGLVLCFSYFSAAPKAWVFKWGRRYRKVFPWVFHLVALAFAAVHLRNFVFAEVQWWMMMILVTPQWLTGLVLGWMRVQRGVVAAMLLHALFNLGPLTVAWLALRAGLE